MRFKYYLRGCGLGIVLTAIILMIGFHRNGGDRMSDPDIMQRASELGMITPKDPDTDPIEPTQADNAGANEADGAGADTEATAKPTESGEQDRSNRDEKEVSEKDSEDREKEDSEKDEPEKITIVVRRGEVCRELAEELAEQGLVPDAEEFRLYMQENGFDNLIRVGEYTLTVGMDQEEIAKILTTKPE